MGNEKKAGFPSHSDRVQKWIDEGQENILSFTNRWDISLSNCINGVDILTNLINNFNQDCPSNTKKLSPFIKEEIKHYTRYSEYGDGTGIAPKYQTFIPKGYKWFTIGSDYKLKNFLLFDFHTQEGIKQGTRDLYFFDSSNFRTPENVCNEWVNQEYRFIAAASGWAYAAYVEYLNEKLVEIEINQTSSHKLDIPFNSEFDFDKWYNIYLELDTFKDPPTPPTIVGNITESQNNQPHWMTLYNIRKHIKYPIRLKNDFEALQYIKSLNVKEPEPYKFNTDEDRHRDFEAFGNRSEWDYYNFVKCFEKMLTDKIQASNIQPNKYIEALTKEKLIEYGFKQQQIEEILSNNNYEANCINDTGQYWVSMIEGKIYSGEEYFAKGFKMMFPKSADLLPEYYNRKLSDFISKTKDLEQSLFDETECKEQFKKKEIAFVEEWIKDHEKFPLVSKLRDKLKLLEVYLRWIKKLNPSLNSLPAKIEDTETNNFEFAGKTLTSLIDNNTYYEGSINDFNRRLETTSKLIDRHDFIKAEIERVETEYLKEPVVKVYGDWVATPSKFSFHTYVKQGYYDLKKGADTPIDNIISIATLECKNNDPLQYQHSKPYFETSIVNSLRRGVALLLYKKYLNDLHTELLSKPIIEFKEKNSNGNLTETQLKTLESLIKVELHERLNEVEGKIKNKIENWKQGIDLIGCAAFCQLLYDKKYFIKGCTNRKSVNSFSLLRYGTDIEIQLHSKFRFDRDRHKTLLEVHFK